MPNLNENFKDAAAIAQKRYGQNFLKDERIQEQIIEAMPAEVLPIAEIGPGLGDLTKRLVKVRRVTAFEVDGRMCKYLREEFQEAMNKGRLELYCGDVMKERSVSLLDEPYHLVANLPYYIATAIILKALHDPLCKGLVVMVQKEVAVKFSAHKKDRNFSSLSVLAQSVANVELCFDVPPEAFAPPPKVTSAVLRMEKFATLEDYEFENFLRKAFSQPRKTLRKNLSGTYAKSIVDATLSERGIATSSRPHEVDTSDYHLIYKALMKDRTDGKESREKSAAKQRKRG